MGLLGLARHSRILSGVIINKRRITINFGELKNTIAVDKLGRDDDNTLTEAGLSINWLLTEYLPSRGLKPFLLNDDITTTASIEYVALPANFAGLKLARLQQSDGSYATLGDFEWTDLNDVETGEPTEKMVLPHTATWRLYLRLIPDDTYTINIWYFAKQTTLVADATTPILSTIYGNAPIISGAAWRTAVSLGLKDDISRWDYTFRKIDFPELLAFQARLKGYKKHSPTRSPYQ